MAWHRKITERAFFILIFVLVSTLGAAHMLGVSGNQILETAVNAIISTVVAIFVTLLVFSAERRRVR